MMRNLILVFCFLASATVGRSQAVTVDSVRAEFAKGDHRATLRMISNALENATDDDTHYDLLMLRGECLIQLRERDSAVAAFTNAMKSATDARRHFLARANKVLMQKSPASRFSPPGKQPLDITNLEARKQAAAILGADLVRQNKPAVTAALKSSSIPALESAFQGLADQAALETLCDGKPDQTFTEARAIADRAYDLMQQNVAQSRKRIRQIAAIALSGDNWGGNRGLYSQDRRELEDTIHLLNQIRDHAVAYQGMAKKLDQTGQRWEAMIAEASAVINDGQTLSRQQF